MIIKELAIPILIPPELPHCEALLSDTTRQFWKGRSRPQNQKGSEYCQCLAKYIIDGKYFCRKHGGLYALDTFIKQQKNKEPEDMKDLTHVKIEKGIPIPDGRGYTLRLPLNDMAIGDSILVLTKDASTKRVCQYANYHGKKLNKRFISRAVLDGTRVWRAE